MVLGNQARGGSGSIGAARRIAALTMMICCLLGACGSGSSQSSRPVLANDAAAYRVLAEESQVQGEAVLGVAVNAADYQALWKRAGFAEELPPVNFNDQAVVIVTSSYGSGCEPLFARLRIQDAEIEVQFVGREPGQTCAADENIHGVGLAISRAILSAGPYSVRAGASLVELALD